MTKKIALLCLSKYMHIGCIKESIENIKKYSQHNVDIFYLDTVIESTIKNYFNYILRNEKIKKNKKKDNIIKAYKIFNFIKSSLYNLHNNKVNKNTTEYQNILKIINKLKKKELNITKSIDANIRYSIDVDKILCNIHTLNEQIFTNIFNNYAGIIVHYDLIDSLYLYPSYNIFENYKGIKICMMQDEYIHNINFVKDNNFDFFYHVSNTNLICKYNKKLLEGIKLRQILTGYVPNINIKKIYMKNKTINIFYRGRLKLLSYFYGGLINDKINIGIKMKKYAIDNKINNIDIELEDKYRIYGQEWYNRLQNSKTTLAAPSGCDVFHVSKNEVDLYQKKYPNLTYEKVRDHFNLEKEYNNNYGVVSPRMFEAIKCNCVLIMFPGIYNNILKPNIHYIELQKDFSNIEDVMKKIHDNDFLQNMADRAYRDIVESGKYSFQHFIKNILDPDLSS